MKYLLLALICIAYCVIHSAMVSVTATNFLKRRLGSTYRYYRLFYNIVASISLVPVILYSLSVKSDPFFEWKGWLVIVKYVMVASGFFLFVTGGLQYDLMEFSGISQMKNGTNPVSSTCDTFRTSGVLGLVRHPCYTGLILLAWSRDIDLSWLIISMVLTIYIIIGTLLEERKLVMELGDVYRDYQKKVSIFLPIKWAWSKIKL